MARTSLRKKIEALEVDAVLKVPRDYEENTVRTSATKIGKATGRSYSVIKNVETRTFTVVRNS